MLFKLLLLSFLVLSCASNGNAGVTSTFVRSQWPSVDIPLDNEVFAVPKGYNAPQQVSFRSLSCIIVNLYIRLYHIEMESFRFFNYHGIFVATSNHALIFGFVCSFLDAGSISYV